MNNNSSISKLNTHYPSTGIQPLIIGFCIFDIVTRKYFTSYSSWSKHKSRSEVVSTRQIAKSVFPEPRFAVVPFFDIDRDE